jgi:hypothetical protein
MILGWLIACTGAGGDGAGSISGSSSGDSGPVADYTLKLVPVVPRDDNPFEGVDRIDLLLDSGTGEPLRVSLDAPASGDSAKAEDLPALDDTVIEVEGYSAGEIVAWGRSAPVTADSGEVEVRIFVSRPGAIGEVGALPDAAVWSGGVLRTDGTFLVLGGVGNRQSGSLGSAIDSIVSLNLESPEADLGWQEAGTLPTYVDGGGGERTERAGFTLTPLSTGDDAGRYLLAGGCESEPFEGNLSATPDSQIFDADSGEFSRVSDRDALVYPRCGHVASARQDGSVLVWGGWGYTGERGSYLSLPTGEVWDPALGSFSNADGPADAGFVGTALADLGEDGTLVCGGAVFDVDNDGFIEDWRTTEACFRITLRGQEGDEEYTGMPSLAAHAMVALDDGDVLAFGGVATGSGGKGLGETATASSGVWRLYHGSQTWSQVGSMKLARAGHSVVRLDESHVLIAGGSPEWGATAHADSALSCVEVYDAGTNVSTMVGSCGESDDAGGLPNRAEAPTLLIDPERGVLLAGGLDGSAGAQAGTAFYAFDR